MFVYSFSFKAFFFPVSWDGIVHIPHTSDTQFPLSWVPTWWVIQHCGGVSDMFDC